MQTYLIPRDINQETHDKLVSLDVRLPMCRGTDYCSLCAKVDNPVNTIITVGREGGITLKPCNHHFHSDCYRKWIRHHGYTCHACNSACKDLIIWNADELIEKRYAYVVPIQSKILSLPLCSSHHPNSINTAS